MLKPEPFSPNFEAIEAADIWKDQVAPMLEALYFEALENQAGLTRGPILPGANLPTLEDYHYWRGWVAALNMVKSLPGEAVRLKREAEAQKKTDEAIQQRSDRTRDYRRQSA